MTNDSKKSRVGNARTSTKFRRFKEFVKDQNKVSRQPITAMHNNGSILDRLEGRL